MKLERRIDDGRFGSGGRWEEVYADERFGDEGVLLLDLPRDARGRLRERREDVDAVTVVDVDVAMINSSAFLGQ